MKINGVEFIQHHNYHPLRGTIQGGMIITTTNSSGGTDLVKRDKNNINNIIERVPLNLRTSQSVIEDFIAYGDNTFNAVDDEDEKNLETQNKLRNLDNSLKLYDSMKKYTKKSGKPMPNINWMDLDFVPTMKTNKVVKSEKKIKSEDLIATKLIPTIYKNIQQLVKKDKYKQDGAGKNFEQVIVKDYPEILYKLNKEPGQILNNENTKNIISTPIWGGRYLKDTKGEWKKDNKGNYIKELVDIRLYYIIDLSLKNCDIELKYWNTYQYEISMTNKTQSESGFISSIESGIPMQYTKISGYKISRANEKDILFIPYFINLGTDENPKMKLYNVWNDLENKWVNKDFIKDYYLLIAVKEGIYSYCVNKDNSLDYSLDRDEDFKGNNGEELFRIYNDKNKKKFKISIDKWNKEL
jgi:hypothetical protein